MWESTGNGEYFVYEDPRGNTLGRGTTVSLHLKEEAQEFLEEHKLREIMAVTDHVYVMRQGQIVADRRTADTSPESKVVKLRPMTSSARPNSSSRNAGTRAATS